MLTEAAEWLQQRGTPLWSRSDLGREVLAPDVAAGCYVLAFEEERAVGTMRLTLEDPSFWPDGGADEAVYVHRLAVRRTHAGGQLSGALLEWAAARARELGRPSLRLDCDARRSRLRELYAQHGFRSRGERQVGEFVVARFEKPA